MKRTTYATVMFALVLAVAVASAARPANYEVKWVGELHTVMMGDDKAVIALDSLELGKGFYALGPVEGMDGEITVFDGEPSIAMVVEGQPRIQSTMHVKAALLIWTRVAKWASVPLPPTLRSLDDLDVFVGKAARDHGFNPTAPFPFRVTARLEAGRMHILDRRGRPVRGHEDHDKIQMTIPLAGTMVEMLGFWSDHHQGVLTHMGSNMHVHARTIDDKLSGHVDEVSIVSGQLWLPAGE
jgi:hypothetical protein